MLISTGGTVIKMPVDGIRRMGRATQGVIVMRLRGDEQVSSLAPVVESDEPSAAETDVEPDGAEPLVADVDFDDPDEPEDEDDEPDADDDGRRPGRRVAAGPSQTPRAAIYLRLPDATPRLKRRRLWLSRGKRTCWNP